MPRRQEFDDDWNDDSYLDDEWGDDDDEELAETDDLKETAPCPIVSVKSTKSPSAALIASGTCPRRTSPRVGSLGG